MKKLPSGLSVPNHVRAASKSEPTETPAEGTRHFPIAPRICTVTDFAAVNVGADGVEMEYVMVTVQGFDLMQLAEMGGDAPHLAFTTVLSYQDTVDFCIVIREAAAMIAIPKRT